MFIHKVLLVTAGIFSSFAASQAVGGEIFLECQPESTNVGDNLYMKLYPNRDEETWVDPDGCDGTGTQTCDFRSDMLDNGSLTIHATIKEDKSGCSFDFGYKGESYGCSVDLGSGDLESNSYTSCRGGSAQGGYRMWTFIEP